MASGSEQYKGINAGRKARAGQTKAGKRKLKKQGSRIQTPQEAGTPF